MKALSSKSTRQLPPTNSLMVLFSFGRVTSLRASSKILLYVSKPRSLIKPLCSPPSKFPAPLISRSFKAMFSPSPKLENSSNAKSLFLASTFRLESFGTKSLQNAFLFDLPTLPLIWCRSDKPNI